MRKLAIFIICLLALFVTIRRIYPQETIKIETSRGNLDLIIYDNYEELKEAYIDMAKLYIEERFDHEESLFQIKELLEISKQYTDLLKRYDRVILELSKIPIYRNSILIGTGWDIIIPDYKMNAYIGYGGLIINIFFYELLFKFPDIEIALILGIQF